MRALTSQLPGNGRNADRVLVTENAVLVLDGASAFEPVPVDPGEYAETLGEVVARRLTENSHASIADAVEAGIAATARVFGLRPGRSPSSTIAVLRTRDQAADLYSLGDSTIYYGTSRATNILCDDRLSGIAKPQRAAYRAALRAGHGYDQAHRDALRKLQQVQREYRNRSGGYWIAEADPTAAHQAFTATIERPHALWAVLGTDGATDIVPAVTSDSWFEISRYSQRQLDWLLLQADRWESQVDPIGRDHPRAKQHDDKTLALVSDVFG